MDTFDAITQRRSVKHYDPNHEMTEAEIEKLLSAAILSPTSFNIQNWRFVLVRNPELRKQIRAAAWNQAQITDASLTIVLTGDLRAHAKDPDRYWANAPETIRNILVPMIGQFYDNQEGLQRDEVMRSVGIAGQTIMLAAKAMGYDSCPIIGFDPVKVAEIINLPEDHAIGMIVVVGKAAKPAHGRGGQLPMDEVVLTDRFA